MKHTSTHFRWVSIITMLILLAFSGLAPVYAQVDTVETAGVYAELYDTVSPSVVSISVVARRDGSGMIHDGEAVVGGGTGFVLTRIMFKQVSNGESHRLAARQSVCWDDDSRQLALPTG